MAHKATLADEVKLYLLSDRQWKREHRIAHAAYKLETANTANDKEFWSAILDALMVHRLIPRKP